ncbi:unnamed protein product [Amoebophrya sp. A120]|nr:unnamed protein product [Amoebophrya sp. A120]|eukprot:GSA120T00003255001.1
MLSRRESAGEVCGTLSSDDERMSLGSGDNFSDGGFVSRFGDLYRLFSPVSRRDSAAEMQEGAAAGEEEDRMSLGGQEGEDVHAAKKPPAKKVEEKDELGTPAVLPAESEKKVMDMPSSDDVPGCEKVEHEAESKDTVLLKTKPEPAPEVEDPQAKAARVAAKLQQEASEEEQALRETEMLMQELARQRAELEAKRTVKPVEGTTSPRKACDDQTEEQKGTAATHSLEKTEDVAGINNSVAVASFGAVEGNGEGSSSCTTSSDKQPAEESVETLGETATVPAPIEKNSKMDMWRELAAKRPDMVAHMRNLKAFRADKCVGANKNLAQTNEGAENPEVAETNGNDENEKKTSPLSDHAIASQELHVGVESQNVQDRNDRKDYTQQQMSRNSRKDYTQQGAQRHQHMQNQGAAAGWWAGPQDSAAGGHAGGWGAAQHSHSQHGRESQWAPQQNDGNYNKASPNSSQQGTILGGNKNWPGSWAASPAQQDQYNQQQSWGTWSEAKVNASDPKSTSWKNRNNGDWWSQGNNGGSWSSWDSRNNQNYGQNQNQQNWWSAASDGANNLKQNQDHQQRWQSSTNTGRNQYQQQNSDTSATAPLKHERTTQGGQHIRTGQQGRKNDNQKASTVSNDGKNDVNPTPSPTSTVSARPVLAAEAEIAKPAVPKFDWAAYAMKRKEQVAKAGPVKLAAVNKESTQMVRKIYINVALDPARYRCRQRLVRAHLRRRHAVRLKQAREAVYGAAVVDKKQNSMRGRRSAARSKSRRSCCSKGRAVVSSRRETSKKGTRSKTARKNRGEEAAVTMFDVGRPENEKMMKKQANMYGFDTEKPEQKDKFAYFVEKVRKEEWKVALDHAFGEKKWVQVEKPGPKKKEKRPVWDPKKGREFWRHVTVPNYEWVEKSTLKRDIPDRRAFEVEKLLLQLKDGKKTLKEVLQQKLLQGKKTKASSASRAVSSSATSAAGAAATTAGDHDKDRLHQLCNWHMTRTWLQSVQRLVWNHVASVRLERNGTSIEVGDVLRYPDGTLRQVTERDVEKPNAEKLLRLVALPLPGKTIPVLQYPTNLVSVYEDFLRGELGITDGLKSFGKRYWGKEAVHVKGKWRYLFYRPVERVTFQLLDGTVPRFEDVVSENRVAPMESKTEDETQETATLVPPMEKENDVDAKLEETSAPIAGNNLAQQNVAEDGRGSTLLVGPGMQSLLKKAGPKKCAATPLLLFDDETDNDNFGGKLEDESENSAADATQVALKVKFEMKRNRAKNSDCAAFLRELCQSFSP